MKCEICGKDILKDSQCIDYKYYHNDCIINLTKENKQLKEVIDKLRKEINEEYSIMGVEVVENWVLKDILKEVK